jgi:ABC-2 type transport system ATP-binding protein
VAPTISTQGLKRSFGATVAVDGLDLDIDAGEVVALLGPNGAGKTTTVRLLNGVLRPDAGTATVLGLDPATQGEAVRRRTGVLTETSGLDDRLSAMQNVTTYARIRGVSAEQADRQARQLLERFGMGHRADESVQGMSTGQRKRVGLARALLHDPEVLFLDEPTSGLDPAATREVVELMAGLAREQGRTILLCTHFLTEASRLRCRVAILERGRLIAFGFPDDLATELWPGLSVEVELGGALDDRTLAAVRARPGVQEAAPLAGQDGAAPGLRLHLDERDALPGVVAALVTREIAVYGVVPKPPTLEDIYFSLTGHTAEET